MKNKLLLLFLVFVALGSLTFYDYIKSLKSRNYAESTAYSLPTVYEKRAIIDFGKVTVTAEVADTASSQVKGLSHRTSLSEKSGMLFVFDTYKTQIFWMKDMNFPLDIIWIRDDVVVDIDQNIPIPSAEISDAYLPKYSPKEKVNYVLEVNAGFCDKNGVEIGDKADIQL